MEPFGHIRKIVIAMCEANVHDKKYKAFVPIPQYWMVGETGNLDQFGVKTQWLPVKMVNMFDQSDSLNVTFVGYTIPVPTLPGFAASLGLSSQKCYELVPRNIVMLSPLKNFSHKLVHR